jgi:hypothetical protein
MVTGDIIPGSPSIGILVIVYSLGNDSNIHYSMVEYTKIQQPRMYPVMSGLSMGDYEVVFFVVEEDLRPFPRAAATPRTVRIHGNIVCTVTRSRIFKCFVLLWLILWRMIHL